MTKFYTFKNTATGEIVLETPRLAAGVRAVQKIQGLDLACTVGNIRKALKRKGKSVPFTDKQWMIVCETRDEIGYRWMVQKKLENTKIGIRTIRECKKSTHGFGRRRLVKCIIPGDDSEYKVIATMV